MYVQIAYLANIKNKSGGTFDGTFDNTIKGMIKMTPLLFGKPMMDLMPVEHPEALF